MACKTIEISSLSHSGHWSSIFVELHPVQPNMSVLLDRLQAISPISPLSSSTRSKILKENIEHPIRIDA